jgi:hypothetical protein
MRNLNKLEKNVLRFIDSTDTNKKNKIIYSLKETLGFDYEESLNFFILWYFLNGKDYDELVFDDDFYNLSGFIENVMNSDNPDEYTDTINDENNDFIEKIYGERFNFNLRSIPSLEWESDELKLNLTYEDWEYSFSGLDEDSIHLYYDMYNNNYIDYSYEVDEEEFRYVYTNDETIELLETIAILKDKTKWPGKRGPIDDGEVDDFLLECLYNSDYNNIKDNYIDTMSYLLKNERIKGIREIYEENIKYHRYDCSSNYSDVCISIPYSDLLEIIKEKQLINLSDLFDAEVNGSINLTDEYFSIYLSEDDSSNLLSEFNEGLSKIIDDMVEGSDDLDSIINQRKEFLDYINKLGFVENENMDDNFIFDNYVSFNLDDVNFGEYKIKIKYLPNNSQHIIPIDNLSDWISGSVLDLNESVRYKRNKKVIKEMKQEVEKITIFDFDGTLMNTPHPENGIPLWESVNKKKYPHVGWWSKPESLDDSIFDISTINETVKMYSKEIEKPNTLVIMLTGRLPQQSLQVEELLHVNGLYFDEYHYKGKGDTLSSKINTIKNLIDKYPKVKQIDMYEDRKPHAIEFLKWGEENGVNINVFLVEDRV